MVYGFLYVLLPLHILTKPNLFLSLENNKSTKKYTLCSGDLFFFFSFFSSFFLLFFGAHSVQVYAGYFKKNLKLIFNNRWTTLHAYFCFRLANCNPRSQKELRAVCSSSHVNYPDPTLHNVFRLFERPANQNIDKFKPITAAHRLTNQPLGIDQSATGWLPAAGQGVRDTGE